MNVNQKGHIGLVNVIRDLTIKGYEVFLPSHDYSSVDLIALDASCIPKRIQVKYRESYRNKVEIPLYSVVNRKKVPIRRGDIDGWAVYCADIDEVIYVRSDYKMESNSSLYIRIQEGAKTVNASLNACPMYSDFLDSSMIWEDNP